MSMLDFSLWFGLGICVVLVAANVLAWAREGIDKWLADFFDGGAE